MGRMGTTNGNGVREVLHVADNARRCKRIDGTMHRVRYGCSNSSKQVGKFCGREQARDADEHPAARDGDEDPAADGDPAAGGSGG